MPGASEAVRSFPYPALDEGSLSFPDGSYEVEIQAVAGRHAAHVQHDIQSAPLIRRLVEEGKAACACVVSVPVTGYRRLFLEKSFGQTIKWDEFSVGEPPVFQPRVICLEDIEHSLSENDGVHRLWVGQKVIFPKGAKIAFSAPRRLMSSMTSLLSFKKIFDKNAKQISVDPCSEEGFYFKVSVQADLFDFLQQPGEGNHLLRRSIMVHAISACFALLARQYSNREDEEDGWQAYPNLLALSTEMEGKGLTLWDEEDFHPEEAATVMCPYHLPAQEQEN